MATEVKLPELGENLKGGDVLDVRVKPGDTVREGQTLLEVEAEKSTVEVPSPVSGKLAKLLVNKGDSITVGQALCVIDEGDGAKDGEEKEAKAPAREAPAAEKEPDTGMSAAHGGEPSRPKQQEKEVAEAVAKAPSDGNGRRAETRRAPEPPKEEKRSPQPAPPREESRAKIVPAGPATRRLARELGVDLGEVRGTAAGGRVTVDDVKNYVRDVTAGGGPVRAAGPVTAPVLPDFERWGPVERKPLDGVRKKTAEQMSLAWSLIPHVTQHDLADVTDLESFRKEREGKGPKLTVTAFALKAVAIALKQFPQFNATLDTAAGQLILKRYYHIGIAVDTERGLLVPVVRDVDKKSVEQLAQELADVAERTRQKKLAPDEMKGGTFTITNLGGIGGTAFTPIVNYPEVAILGLSRSRLQPVVKDSQVVPRLLLPLSLSYDHRVIDGADAARFTRRVAEMLENPLLMLLHA